MIRYSGDTDYSTSLITGYQRASSDRYKAVYELVARLAVLDSLDTVLMEVVQASISLVGADAGYIRLFDLHDLEPLVDSGVPFVAQVGISERYARYFSDLVQPVNPEARAAAVSGKRVIVEDMYTDPAFQPHRHIVIAEGYRSMQGTPFMSADGERCLGGVVTCFIESVTPAPETFETLDLYAEIAASAIERQQRIGELTRRGRELADLLGRQRECLELIQERLQRLDQRAYSIEPEDLRRAARSVGVEIDRILSEADANAGSDEPAHVDGLEYPYGLSEREMEVLLGIWRGQSDKQIALALDISRFTVFKHVRMVLQKLGVDTRTQAGVRTEHEALYKYATKDLAGTSLDATG
jgi:DNA-binding CsgD family transcriptional regulator